MIRALLVAAVVALVSPGGVSAATVVAPGSDSSRPWQQWIDESRMPTPDATLEIRSGSTADGQPLCGSVVLGCYVPARGIVYVSDLGGRWTLLHELGHAFDTEARRPAAVKLVDGDAATWWSGGGAERFADLYASCARYGVHAPPSHRRGVHGQQTYRAGCRWIRAGGIAPVR